MAFIAAAVAFTGCSENAWNDHLDGFEGGNQNINKVTVSYTLTPQDYEAISKALAKVASTPEEAAAAAAIASNNYFDQSSPYTAQTAIPYLLDQTDNDFYIYPNGSVAQISFGQAEETNPAIGQISSAYTYTITNPTSPDAIPDILETEYPDAEEGQYAIVSYLAETASSNTPAETASKASNVVKVNTRAGESPYWSVAQALAYLEENPTGGEAVVKGVVSKIDDLDTGNYGNATYYIKDNMDATDELEIYRGYYIDGQKFTSKEQLEVGDYVVVSGKLVVYNGTKEFTSGSKLLSVSGFDISHNITDITLDENLTATAWVTAQATNGLVLTDLAGSIFYYNTGVDLSQYPIGTVITISGKVGAYNNGFQMPNSSTIEILGQEEYFYPTPVEFVGNDFDNALTATGNQLAQYITFQGQFTGFSGNYGNIKAAGTDVGISLYYTISSIKEKLIEGKNYIINGYFTSFNAKSSYFYVIPSAVEEIIPEVDPADLTNAIFQFNGTEWVVPENTTVLQPADYSAMGSDINRLEDPNNYLPQYLKTKYPYAQIGDEMFVAYNISIDSCLCGLYIYDGSKWSQNDNSYEFVTAAFTKNEGNWNFWKYLGVTSYTIFNEEYIKLPASYMIAYSTFAAVAYEIDPSSTNPYGYLTYSTIEPIDGVVKMPNDNNAFYFTPGCVVDGEQYFVNGSTYFLIQDINGYYLYLRGYNSFNYWLTPTIENGQISNEFIWHAENNGDGTWSITNMAYPNTIYYSTRYNNFAAYDSGSDTSFLPTLYIMQ